MGGCRCLFRDCNVCTSRNPRMHFFKFPVADKKRFETWIKFSGANDVRHLRRSQQFNRVICARHFRDESFMNYKKDRLCPNQVPTITRISESLALDYEDLEEDGCTPKLIKLYQPTQPHLIPPPDFECPLDLGECIDDIDSTLQLATPVVKPKTSGKRPKLSETTSNLKRFKPKNEKVKESSTTIDLDDIETNQGTDQSFQESSVSCTDKKLQEVAHKPTLIELRKSSQSDRISPSDCVSSPNVDPSNDLTFANQESEPPSLKKILTKGNTTISNVETEKMCFNPTESSCNLSQLKEERESAKEDCTRESEFSKNLSKSKIDIDSMEEYKKKAQSNYDQLADEHRKLQAAHAELTAKCCDLEKQLKASTIQPPSAPKAIQQPLTKAQIFNGVKRYLCSSMTTLVRMEMFGSPERQWKPDEKQVTVDLLRLGENVYNYFTDEWRFRMPSLRVARNWLDDSTSHINEDEENL